MRRATMLGIKFKLVGRVRCEVLWAAATNLPLDARNWRKLSEQSEE